MDHPRGSPIPSPQPKIIPSFDGTVTCTHLPAAFESSNHRQKMRLFLRENTFKFPPNATFICSVPSWGTVGQMACDVLLATLHSKGLLERIGTIESHHVLPMAGYDSWGADAPQHLCVPIEVYAIVGKSIFIIHQRSICDKGRRLVHCREFLTLIESLCPSSEGGKPHIVVVTGSGTEDIEAIHSGRVFVATAVAPKTSTFASSSSASSSSSSAAASVPSEQMAACSLSPPAPLPTFVDDLTRTLTSSNISHSDATADLQAFCDQKFSLGLADTGLTDPLSENDYEGFLTSATPYSPSLDSSESSAVLLESAFFGCAMAKTLFMLVHGGDYPVPTATPAPTPPAASAVATASAGSQEEHSVCLTVLGRYCMEGDNRADAGVLAGVMLCALGVLPVTGNGGGSGNESGSGSGNGNGKGMRVWEKELRHPTSWEALFGPPMSADTQANMFF